MRHAGNLSNENANEKGIPKPVIFHISPYQSVLLKISGSSFPGRWHMLVPCKIPSPAFKNVFCFGFYSCSLLWGKVYLYLTRKGTLELQVFWTLLTLEPLSSKPHQSEMEQTCGKWMNGCSAKWTDQLGKPQQRQHMAILSSSNAYSPKHEDDNQHFNLCHLTMQANAQSKMSTITNASVSTNQLACVFPGSLFGNLLHHG